MSWDVDPHDRLRRWHAAERDAIAHRQGCAAAVARDLRACSLKYRAATPSIEGLAERTGYSTRQIKRATAWLAERGRLTVTRRRAHCRGDGTWHRSQTNLYTPRWPGRDLPAAPTFTRRPCSHRGDMDGTSTKKSVRSPSGEAVPAVTVDKPPDPPPPPAPEPAPPTVPQPPPWTREGITREEWRRRQIGAP